MIFLNFLILVGQRSVPQKFRPLILGSISDDNKRKNYILKLNFYAKFKEIDVATFFRTPNLSRC